jgi:PadR family transcriptional regulator PadR
MLTTNTLKLQTSNMPADKSDVLHGTLDLIILKTLDAMGPLHGYAVARRIEQISSDQLSINQGTLYPALLKLEQHGWISRKWGESATGRRVKFYTITPRGRRQLQSEEADWARATGIVAKFFGLAKATR